jgi:hypothetical protein
MFNKNLRRIDQLERLTQYREEQLINLCVMLKEYKKLIEDLRGKMRWADMSYYNTLNNWSA